MTQATHTMHTTHASDADLVRLVYQEARLVDQGRFDAWYDLFDADGLYWMPLAPDQQDGAGEPALLYEDKLLLRLRLDRMRDPKAHSLHPAVRCLHVLQAPEITQRDDAAGRYVLSTPFLYVETQGDTQHVLAATAEHTVVATPQGLRIRTKKVLLLNCDAALPAIQLLP